MRSSVAMALGAPLETRDQPDLEPGPGEVIVAVKACGICFTDLRIIDLLGGPAMPLVPGHEFVGEVARLGAGVEGVRVGQRVGVHALYVCGVCGQCRRGEEEACDLGFGRLAGLAFDGGYAEEARAPADRLVTLPDGIDFASAAPFFCAGLTCYAGLRNGGVEPGQRVVVIGVGGLGHLAIPIARALGVEVYAATSSPDKADDARRLGASFVGDVAAVTAELADRGGAHLVLQTANSLDPLAALLPGLAKQCAVVLAAADGDSLPIPPMAFTALQLRLIGSFFGSRADLLDVLALAEAHQITPVIERFRLDDVNIAHDRLRANRVRYRAVLDLTLP